jgi:hypothetical protein
MKETEMLFKTPPGMWEWMSPAERRQWVLGSVTLTLATFFILVLAIFFVVTQLGHNMLPTWLVIMFVISGSLFLLAGLVTNVVGWLDKKSRQNQTPRKPKGPKLHLGLFSIQLSFWRSLCVFFFF